MTPPTNQKLAEYFDYEGGVAEKNNQQLAAQNFRLAAKRLRAVEQLREAAKEAVGFIDDYFDEGMLVPKLRAALSALGDR